MLWIPRIVLALLVGGVYAIASVADTLHDARLGALEVRLASSASGMLQVFYDRGAGIREADSVVVEIAPSDELVTYRLPLPAGRYRLWRLDPNTRAGRYVFGQLRVVNRRGETLAVLSPDDIRSTIQASVERSGGGAFTVTTPPDANDPQLEFAPATPPLLVPGVNLAGVATRSFAATLAALLIAMLADRVTAFSTPFARVGAWARRRPYHAIVCAGVAGALVATYPLLLGRSLVSPAIGPAFMLYDRPPFVYGAAETMAEDARGADIGATMWQVLPYTIMQREALAMGELPLWNRYNTAGEPLWGQAQTFALDPFHLASLAIPDPATAMDVRFVVARAVFAVGTGAAVVAATGNWGAGALLALVAPFVGHFTMRFNHPAYFAIVYAPWILWAYARLATVAPAARGSVAVWLAGATFLQMVGTTPKEGLMGLVAAHAAGMAGLLLGRDAWRDTRGRMVAALVGGVAALLMTAPHWVIFVDTLSRSWTLYDQPGIQLAGAPHLAAFVLGALATGMPLTGVHPLAVMGALMLIAFPGRLVRSGSALGAVLVIVLLGALAFGLVPTQFLLRVPLIASIHHVGNAFLAATIAPWLLAAGIGVAWALDRASSGPALAATLVLAGAALGIALVPERSLEVATLMALLSVLAGAAVLLSLCIRWRPAAAGVLAFCACAAAAIAPGGLQVETGVPTVDALLIQPRPRTDLDEPSPAVLAVRSRAGSDPFRVAPIESVMFAGTQAFWHFEGVGGPDALRLRGVEDVSDALQVERTTWVWRTVLRRHSLEQVRGFLDMMNVRFLVARADQLPGGVAVLPQQGPDQIRAIERASAWPRAFVVDGVEQHPDLATFAERLRQATAPFASVQSDDGAAVDEVTALPRSASAVSAAYDYVLTTNTTSFSVQTAGPGLAVLSEAHVDRDFRATLNGAPVPYIRVNHALKGVGIPRAGSWTVKFEYRPRLWTWTWLLSGLGLTFLIATRLLAGRLLK